MKKTLFILLLFFSSNVQGQWSWEFVNKLYIIDNLGNIDSVMFGNDSLATLGIDSNLNEQNIIGTAWDSLEIRSIQRTSDSVDCPIDYWGMGNFFTENIDLKKDIRKSQHTWSSTFFIFKIHASHYPVEIYSNFGEMFSNTWYDYFSWILNHHFDCSYATSADCVQNYQHLFTIADSTEEYISVQCAGLGPGIKDVFSENIKIYPSPFDIYLLLEGLKNEKYRIEILNITGIEELQIEISGVERTNISTDKIGNGIYFIKLTNLDTGEIQVKKIIKV